jgi:glyoxylase-like metal-dependent hydrolase (beta-lactamase superfamily II)/rhodanese-related sulfurtransferase
VIFEPFHLDCLSQASYLVGSQGHAVVVDPRRDVDVYLAAAAQHGLTITDVIATHLHADFVAGLRELADRSGARIWVGSRFVGAMPCRRLADGQSLRIGSVTLRTLETPGHTPDSICLLVRDEAAPAVAPKLLSGDTLLVGALGRPEPDGAGGPGADALAGLLFDSLRTRILPLDDRVEVWPAHLADRGPPGGLGAAAPSTIGRERRDNPALRIDERAAFVAAVCRDLPDLPRYFAEVARQNREGPRLRRERPRLRELGDLECSVVAENGAVLLDVRPSPLHCASHPPLALNIPLDARFAAWCGRLIEPGRRIVIAATAPAEADEAWLRLARVGHEAVIGWCRLSPERCTAALPQHDAHQLHAELRRGRVQVVDVRESAEFVRGSVPGAHHAPLERLPVDAAGLAGLDPTRRTAIVCAHGCRSSTAAWFLRRRGFGDLGHLAGGTEAWRAAGYALEA